MERERADKMEMIRLEKEKEMAAKEKRDRQHAEEQ